MTASPTTRRRGAPTPPAPRYLALAEAAAKYDLSIKTLRRRIADGSLPAYRMGPKLLRVSESDLEALLHRLPTAGQ